MSASYEVKVWKSVGGWGWCWGWQMRRGQTRTTLNCGWEQSRQQAVEAARRAAWEYERVTAAVALLRNGRTGAKWEPLEL